MEVGKSFAKQLAIQFLVSVAAGVITGIIMYKFFQAKDTGTSMATNNQVTTNPAVTATSPAPTPPAGV